MFLLVGHVTGSVEQQSSAWRQNKGKHLGSTVLNFTSIISMYNEVFVQSEAWLQAEGHYCQLFKYE